jgi:RNA polymerase sporulation-specific sigma factor
VKVSRPVKELAYKVHRTQERLQGVLGRDPTIMEIAKELSLAPQEVVAALEAIQTPTSLYANVFHDDGDPILLLDQMKYCEEEDSAYFEKLALKEIVLRLPEKERLVIHLRFFADKTQAEVAQIIGLSQVQISRIEKQALKLMKEFMQTS